MKSRNGFYISLVGICVLSAIFFCVGLKTGQLSVSSTNISANVSADTRPFYAEKPLLIHEGKSVFVEDLPPFLQTQTRFIMDSYRQQMEGVAVDVAVLISMSASGTKISDLKSLAEIMGDRVKPSVKEVTDFVYRTRQSFPAAMSDAAVRANSERMLAAQKVAIERNAIRNKPDFDKDFVIPYARPKVASVLPAPSVHPTPSVPPAPSAPLK